MWILGALLIGLLNAWLAEKLQRSVLGWAIAGFLFGLLSTAVLGLLELAKNVRDISDN
jgi:hypothetical protein